MVTPAQREADAASLQFHEALVAIGAQAVAESLVAWEDNPPGSSPEQAARWLERAIQIVMTRRAGSRILGLSYYRLVRALHTGRTVRDPRRREGETVLLSQLRREFERISQQGARPPTPTETPARPPEGAGETPGAPPAIFIDPPVETAAQDRESERLGREEARTVLAALGALRQARLVAELDRQQTAESVDAKRQEAHDAAGATQAAAASRLAQNAARSKLWEMGENDGRVVGYVRLSRTGTPCGWCAMLISRGPVYRSERSATYSGGAATYEDGDKYHDNCNCYAMPIFSREQFNDSSLFALNREYAEAWPRVTRGLSGKAALSAWRRYIKTTRGDQGSPDTAQEAAA